MGAPGKLFPAQIALVEGDFLRAQNLDALAVFQGPYKCRGLVQAVEGSGVEPGIAASQLLHMQVATFKIGPVDISDFQLTAVGRLDGFSNVENVIVVEIEAGYRPIRFRNLRLFLDGNDLSCFGFEFGNTIGLGITHLISEYGCALAAFPGGPAFCRKPAAVEDIVSQNQRHCITANEFPADDKGFGKPIRMCLFGIAQFDAEIGAAT